MRKNLFFVLFGLILVFALTGCGEKSQEDVVKALDKKVEQMSGYKANARMTLQTGSEPQVYEVEIWHKSPAHYRVSLKNPKKDQSQMILRNNEGVFVLTPALNKSFRFQSDWPKNSSQAYLYESLVKDIMDDAQAVFKSTKDHYVFETKTNYKNNKMLPLQEITIKKSSLAPVKVKIMDPDRNTLVTVDFSNVEFNTKFDKDAFDMSKNMTAAQLDVPVSASVDNKPFSVIYPTMELAGTKLTEEKEVATEDGKRVVLTYSGEKSFTLIQEKANVSEVASLANFPEGEPVDLGFTMGALTKNSITWTHNGVEYMLASEDLSQEEMVSIAQSVQGQIGK